MSKKEKRECKLIKPFKKIFGSVKKCFIYVFKKIKDIFSKVLRISYKVLTSKMFYFMLTNVVLFVLIGLFLYFDIDHKINLKLGQEWQVVCQVISSLVVCIITILSISLSIQNDNIFGIKARDFFKLRVMPYFSFMATILISLILSGLSLVAMVLNFNSTLLYIFSLSLFYCVWFVCLEIPLLTRNEKRIFRLLKSSFLQKTKSLREQSSKKENDFNTVLNEMVHTYGIQHTYENLSIEVNKEYNIALLKHILDERCTYITNLNSCEDKEKIFKIFDNTFKDINMIVSGSFNVDEVLGTQETYSYFITRIIFAMSRNSLYTNFIEKIESLIFNLLALLDFKDTQKVNVGLINDILVALIKYPVQEGKLWALEAFKKTYSHFLYSLRGNKEYKKSTLYFATICWYLYYLVEMEDAVPEEIKESLRAFINEPTKVVDKNKYCSWKELYKSFMTYANIKLDELLAIYKDDIYWEYLISGVSKSVVLSGSFIIEWFFETKINSHSFYYFNIEDILDYDERIQNKVKNVLETWFDENKNLIHTDFSKFQSLYEYNIPKTNYFTIDKSLQLKWFNLKNKLKERDLSKELETCTVDNSELQKNLKKVIETKVSQYWHFDNELNLENEKQYYFYGYLEKYNMESQEGLKYFIDTIGEGYATSILHEIHNEIDYTLLLSADKDAAKKIVDSKPEFRNISMPEYFIERISDIKTKDKFKGMIEDTEDISQPTLLPPNSFLKASDFRYNVKIEECLVNDLTEEQINQVIKDNYTRPDGQYFFGGVYLTREKLYEIVKAKFISIKITFRYKVESNKNNIFVWDIWGIKERKGKSK